MNAALAEQRSKVLINLAASNEYYKVVQPENIKVVSSPLTSKSGDAMLTALCHFRRKRQEG